MYLCVCDLENELDSQAPAGQGKNNLTMGSDTRICSFVDRLVQKAPSWSFPPLVVHLDPFNFPKYLKLIAASQEET
jgi:hypothetical protein